jgi:dTDP-3-amino-3,6-dideoxy-alpha-D-glucopyranose N,N-dimethyltransferase
LATYDASAHWYDRLWGARRSYAQDATALLDLAREHGLTGRRLLDVGCATGGHLQHLRRVFDCAGLDISRELLQLAAANLGAGVYLHHADMRDFQLDDRFDLITCLWGTIAYASDTNQLADVAARMAAHLGPGGSIVVEPWLTADAFDDEGMVTVTVDDEQKPVLTVVDATHRHGRVAELRRLYVAATPGDIETIEECHELGLFTRDEYVQAFDAAGLATRWQEHGLTGRGLIIGES